jgi:hypothetical protein
MDIPTLKNVSIQAVTKKDKPFPTFFQCHFHLEDFLDSYYMEIFLRPMDGFSSLVWEGGSLDIVRPDTNTTDMGDFELEFEEHIFEQLVLLILFHSKKRLKLLHYQERAYFLKNFVPGNYKLPNNIIFNH